MGITGTLLLYRLLQYLCFPAIVLYFGARLLAGREDWTHFSERLGFLPQSLTRTDPGAIWLHAVSLGEVASAIPLLERLRGQFPTAPIFLSTTTIAGRHAAEREAAHLTDGIFFSPIDYPSCVRRVLRTLRPALLLILETEIWPNLFLETKSSGAALALVNARISDRTWPTYRRLCTLFRPILQLADVAFVQSNADRERYATLGVSPGKLVTAGNLKYDAASLRQDKPRFSVRGAGPVWIAASTVGPNERGSLRGHKVDEDDIVLHTFAELAPDFPQLLLILAPRQPHRFPVVAQKLQDAGIPFTLRSASPANALYDLPSPSVLLLDTVGELRTLYSLADVVFVGGSLAPRGGHNILEPAAAGVPIVVGPHMQNFAAITADFRHADALWQIDSAADLTETVRNILLDPASASSVGERARGVVEEQRGAAARMLPRLESLYSLARPRLPRQLIARWFLGTLAAVWTVGGTRKRTIGEALAHSRAPLPAPVVSVGGITVGGSGKTPFCDFLAAQLHAQGRSPAILTRGYRRRSAARILVFPPGAPVSPSVTGDEAQIFLRSAYAIVGIGSDRYSTAQAVLTLDSSTDIFILDDGFQHAAMPRNVDIVLIDGLDPFGNGAVVPLGRLREPFEALARAHAFVVTRSENPARLASIRRQLAVWNPHAPLFVAQLEPRVWHSFPSGELVTILPDTPVAAFCGLGNPQSFWNTLRQLRLPVPFRWAFGDHHQYRPTDIQRLVHQARVHGAPMLVTTEKDSMNLPAETKGMLSGLELAWLRVELVMPEREAFFAFVQSVLRRN